MASAATVAEGERLHKSQVEAEAHFKDGVTVGQTEYNNRYPAHLFKNQAEADTKVALTKQLKQSGFGDVVLTDRIVDYFYDKQKEVEFSEKERWLAESFDTSSPEVRAWLNKVSPGFFERREAYALQKLRDQERLVKMAFHGPNSEEDLNFIYHIATGRIDVRELERPPWRQKADRADLNANDNYIAGLFSPKKWTSAVRLGGEDFHGNAINWGRQGSNQNRPSALRFTNNSVNYGERPGERADFFNTPAANLPGGDNSVITGKFYRNNFDGFTNISQANKFQ